MRKETREALNISPTATRAEEDLAIAQAGFTRAEITVIERSFELMPNGGDLIYDALCHPGKHNQKIHDPKGKGGGGVRGGVGKLPHDEDKPAIGPGGEEYYSPEAQEHLSRALQATSPQMKTHFEKKARDAEKSYTGASGTMKDGSKLVVKGNKVLRNGKPIGEYADKSDADNFVKRFTTPGSFWYDNPQEVG